MKIVRLDLMMERDDFGTLVIELFEDERIQAAIACDADPVLIKYRHLNGELITYYLGREKRQDEHNAPEILH